MDSLLALRVDRVKTQAEIAHELGISAPTYNRIEQGKQMPRDPLVRKLAALFDIDPSELREELMKAVAT